jgi:hypothetical protein
VTVTLAEEGTGTAGEVVTDLSITGKPAQFGRGMITEVGGKILDTFAACLAGKLGVPQEETPPTLSAVPTKETGEPEVEPIDLIGYAAPSIAKRVVPVVLALVVVFLWRHRRHRR